MFNYFQNPKSWNVTTYTTKVFLKFSSAFDLFVEDINFVEDIADVLDSKNDSVTFFSALEYAVEILNATNRDTLKYVAHVITDIIRYVTY